MPEIRDQHAWRVMTQDDVVTSRRDRLLVCAALIVSAILLIQLIDYGYGRDQGIYAAVARTIRGGGIPYRDAWDFKPPGIFFVYAVAGALLGSGASAIRWIEAVSFASLVAAFAWLSRCYAGDWRPGIVGGALAILTHVQLEFWHTAQPESFGAIAIVWAMVAAAIAIDRGPARGAFYWMASGALYGMAALLKPTIGVAAGASLTIGLWKARRYATEQWPMVRVIAGFAAGWALPVAACLGFFLVRGGLHDMRTAVLDFAPHYTALGWTRARVPWVVFRVLTDWSLGYSLLLVAGLLLLAVPDEGLQLRDGLLHVGAVVLLLLVGVGLQLKLFPYHYGSALPLTALPAGWGFWKAWRWLRGSRRGIAAFSTMVVLLAAGRTATTDVAGSFWARSWLRATALFHPVERVDIRDRLYSVADYHARDNRLVAEWIERETPASEALYVWGFTPELYVRTGRRFASRYIYDVPQRAPWSRDATRDELMRDLTIARPVTIVVERGDVIPVVTGTAVDSAAEVWQFDRLRQLIASRYRLTLQTPKFDVYRRIS